jgi:hypothetical protein
MGVQENGDAISVRVVGRFVLDATEGATAAAVAGLGIISSGQLGCLAELHSGALVRDINVIMPAGRASKPSAGASADFMASEFRKLPESWGKPETIAESAAARPGRSRRRREKG